MFKCALYRFVYLAWLLPVVLGMACSKSAPPQGKQSDAESSASQNAGDRDYRREEWEVIYRGHEKAGHAWTSVQPVEEQGQRQILAQSFTEIRILRDRELSTVQATYKTWETESGKVLRFESETKLGAAPIHASGRVVGGRMEIRSSSGGKTQTLSVPWADGIWGVGAELRSMAGQPMQPDETRKLRYLDPMLLQVVEVTLHARRFEATKLLDGTRELLRVESTTAIDNVPVPIEFTYWVDRAGEIQKTINESLGIEAYRTTREVALEEFKPTADLVAETTVKLNKPLANPHGTRLVRYRVHLEKGDPAAVFDSGATQQVRSIDPHTAEITVRAPGPNMESLEPSSADDRPTSGDIGASQLIQADDPQIVAMSAEAAGDEPDPWKAALDIEKYVHDSITEKNFSQALSSAADVARSKEGDCTEHAMLLAALARARGIPARIAVGLVSLRDGQAFGYHMWNEVFVNDRWAPLDATLGQGGIGAGHLKVAESDLASPSAFASFFPVVQLLRNLKIDVIEAE